MASDWIQFLKAGLKIDDKALFFRWLKRHVKRTKVEECICVKVVVQVAELKRAHLQSLEQSPVFSDKMLPFRLKGGHQRTPDKRRVDIQAHVGLKKGRFQETIYPNRSCPRLFIFNISQEIFEALEVITYQYNVSDTGIKRLIKARDKRPQQLLRKPEYGDLP